MKLKSICGCGTCEQAIEEAARIVENHPCAAWRFQLGIIIEAFAAAEIMGDGVFPAQLMAARHAIKEELVKHANGRETLQ